MGRWSPADNGTFLVGGWVFCFSSQQRHGDESNLRKEGLIILAGSLGVQPITAGKAWWKEDEAAGDIPSAVSEWMVGGGAQFTFH